MSPREKKAIRKVKVPRVESSDPLVNPVPIEEGCLVPSKVPVKQHRRASLGPELERFEIQEANLERLRKMYYVPKDVRMTILGPSDRVVSPSSRCIAFYEDIFEASVRFPLHPFITNNFDFYTMTPT